MLNLIRRLIAKTVYFLRYRILGQDTYCLDDLNSAIEKFIDESPGHLILDVRHGFSLDFQIASYTIMSALYPVLTQNKSSFYIFLNLDDSREASKIRINRYDNVLINEYPVLVREVANGIYSYVFRYDKDIAKRILMEIFSCKTSSKIIVQKLKLTGSFPEVDSELVR